MYLILFSVFSFFPIIFPVYLLSQPTLSLIKFNILVIHALHGLVLVWDKAIVREDNWESVFRVETAIYRKVTPIEGLGFQV